MTTIIPSNTEDKIRHLVRLMAEQATDGAEITVIARSCDSPVVTALASLRDVSSMAMSFRIVLLHTPPAGWSLDPSRAGFDVRLALNPRLLEAHEQLVVGRSAVWIGDCMRRDPGKRDSFHQDKIGCDLTTRFAAMSFERLWALATPLVAAAPYADLGKQIPQRLAD